MAFDSEISKTASGEIRELDALEIDSVNGGLWPIVAAVAVVAVVVVVVVYVGYRHGQQDGYNNNK